ncbi:MAG: hypothetical protein JKY87_08420 [Mariprofundus sp.]|nr:hypothetical protein [Mariprofundus sp.]
MMRNMIGVVTVVFLASCSHLPNFSDPVEWQKAQPSQQVSGKQVSGQSMDHKNDFFVARKGIEDGYVFIFHIMPAPEGETYSRSNYHLMVSVEKNNQALTHLVISSHIKHPDGSMEENTAMMQMGDWYMSLHNFDHVLGQHWVSVSFEMSGKKYSSGIYYPERAYHQK